MDTRNRPAEQDQEQSSSGKAINPFENNQSADKDIAQSQEDLDKEQQFKEALTERD